MKYRVFIDGAEGTTGLKIHQYFQKRDDIEVLGIEQEKRKDMEERLSMIKKADVSFLCLPDAAAREIVHVGTTAARSLLNGLVDRGYLRAEGENRGRKYYLAAKRPR